MDQAAKRVAAQAGNIEQFGDLPVLQSATVTDRVWTDVPALKPSLAGQTVLVRCRLHGVRAQGRFVFLTLRQRCATVQAVLCQGKGISKAMVKYASGIAKESIVDVEAVVNRPPEPIASCSISVRVAACCGSPLLRRLLVVPSSLTRAVR